jgi:hypothetical protein
MSGITTTYIYAGGDIGLMSRTVGQDRTLTARRFIEFSRRSKDRVQSIRIRQVVVVKQPNPHWVVRPNRLQPQFESAGRAQISWTSDDSRLAESGSLHQGLYWWVRAIVDYDYTIDFRTGVGKFQHLAQ